MEHLTDKELEAQLRRLGTRLDELKAAKRVAPSREHVERGPLGPTDPREAEFLARTGWRGDRNPVFALGAFVLFVRSMRRTR